MADGEEELKKAEIEAEIEAVAKDGHETMQAFGCIYLAHYHGMA